MSPLVLLGLLTFFFAIALSFALWTALTLGDAARRRQGVPQRSRDRKAKGHDTRTARQAERDAALPRPNPALRASQPRPSNTHKASVEAGASPAEEKRVSRVVVTPRQASDDAFERFLESEKRRE